MQIILALVVGAAIGAGIHFLVPDRYTRGVAFAPVLGAASASVAWAVMTWAGIGTDSVWLWLSMLIVPPVVTYPVTLVMARRRIEHDARERVELGIA
ncbi:hypothetical protein [Microbacterium sp. C7(2022)]|uniref:hypothetical protein n=1 Tax=Microbacterium sp. C7(2022) TaxID=2992759 RepID=UPI00237AB46B|nr:hypothetical protein [Microbacterium sp. C7(2022)]MDE0545691.1 hypothetical protein [Microbacterium sp. C7(2022)]